MCILNRCPTKSVGLKTLDRIWSMKKSFVYYFFVFGSITYIYILSAHQIKLNDKVVKCIFISYYERSKVYKLYYSTVNKYFVNKDVTCSTTNRWKLNSQVKYIFFVGLNIFLRK